MHSDAVPSMPNNDIVFTESVYEFFKELFLKGSLSIPVANRSLDVLEALKCESIKIDGDVIRFTYKGLHEFRKHHGLKVNAGLVEVDELKYFGCTYAERTGDGFDGPAIIGSSGSMLNYIKLLQSANHLTLSQRTSECDYAVLDFIDEFTGESYDLYPGDTVVLVDEGYVIHKFTE